MPKLLLSSDPNIRGGAICFDGTRIPFTAIAQGRRGGFDDEAIRKEYPSLTLEQIQGARVAMPFLI